MIVCQRVTWPIFLFILGDQSYHFYLQIHRFVENLSVTLLSEGMIMNPCDEYLFFLYRQ